MWMRPLAQNEQARSASKAKLGERGEKKLFGIVSKFPETYIGDSEDVCKKTPPGKKPLVPQRDVKSASPPSLENKSQDDSPNLADSEEIKEVSLIDSFESDGKRTASPSIVNSDYPLKSPLDHEGYHLCDEEAHLKERSASTGYFPCYRTYVEFPRYQTPAAEGRPGSKGTCRDAGVQCDGFLPEVIGEKRGAEANNNSKETKVTLHDTSSPWGQPHGGSRPGSGGRRQEGFNRHPRLHGDSVQEAGGNPRESSASPKPRTPGSSPSRSGIKLGTAKVAPRSGPWSSPPLPPPANSVCRKSPQKRKHRVSPTDDNDSARSMELKPLLHDQHSLPPSLEDKAGPLPEREHEPCQWTPSVQSGTSPPESPASSPEPHTTPSRLSFHSLVSWVWRIFRKPTQPQPSTSTGTTTSRMPLGSRLRLWLARHSGRVHPEPS
ncbi:hypothetical protein JD844_033994 [Phrynosoma platyrhinos]|uniref:Uncharacterized protein n=1 Tax=Phrynosoma platyrhinos TaxID=52577 RepID=A0ABQ7T957_PHRPL|nr:hypothetical protein JD844_033994 [Phrynosoma platyrhinos]